MSERFCPQCWGTGKVPTGGETLFKLRCDYCFGSGKVRRPLEGAGR